MSRFDSVNFMRMTTDGKHLDVFNAKFKNMAFNIGAERTIQLSAADEHNLPGLAFKYLGDVALWWVLLEYNGLYDAIEDVKAGMVLRIPSRSSIISYLETTPEVASNVVL